MPAPEKYSPCHESPSFLLVELGELVLAWWSLLLAHLWLLAAWQNAQFEVSD